MGKAKRRNAYFFFMRDFKRREEAKGIVFHKGFADVACFASDAWKNTPESVKEKYKKMAEDYNKSEERERGLPGTAAKNKLNSVLPVKTLSTRTKEAKMIAEKEYIKNLLDSLDPEPLLDQLFYLIHVNVFCKTDDDEYFPAEIALSKFTLRDGPLKVFHRFLNAGEIPMGYSYEVKKHADKTHRIPLNLVKAGRGYMGVYQAILNFLKESNPNEIPPIYTMFDEPFHNCSMSAVKHSLKRIWETQNVEIEEDGEIEDDEQYEKVFKVYSLPILFFHLKEKCSKLFGDGLAFPNTSLANLELLKDRYCFDTEIACEFHQDNDNVQFCSQSYTVRWARVIREQCCKFLEEEEEEEEEEEIAAPVVPLKNEKLNLPVKEEKDSVAIKNEVPVNIKIEDKAVKKEKDNGIKTEKDDVKVKAERSDGIKVERDQAANSGDLSVRIKTEKDRGYEDRRGVKTEKDRGYEDRSQSHRNDEVRVKTEKDRGYDDHRSSRDGDGDRRRSYREDEVRVKSEKDRSYNDERRSSRDRDRDDRRRSYDDVRVKKERDRGYDDEHRKGHRDDDLRVKTEKDRGYDDRSRSHREDGHSSCRIKTEKDEGYQSRPTLSREQLRTQSQPNLKNELVRAKIEKPDYDSILKTEHVDIPYTPLKDERPYSQDSNTRAERESSRTQPPLVDEPVGIKTEKPDYYDFILKTEHVDIPFTPINDERQFSNARDPRAQSNRDPRLQNQQTSRDPRIRAQPSTSQNKNNDIPMPIIKTERDPEPKRSHDFPMPIPIKQERSAESRSELPSSIPIKVEKSLEQQGNQNRQNDFPMPMVIKTEKSSDTSTTRKDDFPMPMVIKTEKSSDTSTTRQDDFPMPMVIKTEKSSDTRTTRKDEFPMPMVIKTEKSSEPKTAEKNDFPMPKPIKVERSSDPRSASYRNEFPLPIPIKEEKEDVSQKITTEPPNSSAYDNNKRKLDSTGNVTTKRQRPVESVVKNEPSDCDECPPTPRREDFPEMGSSNVRIKAEPTDTYGIKHEEVYINNSGRHTSQWEPMECDPVREDATGAGDLPPDMPIKSEPIPGTSKKEKVSPETYHDVVIKDEIFTSDENID